MQNIPSHAKDIRHMFRATPTSDQIIDCDYDEFSDVCCVDVPRINYVIEKTRGKILVSSINIGDSIRLLEDGKEVYRIVKEISVADNDPIICHVVF